MRGNKMNNKNTTSRITIDITKEQHRRLKAKAAILGKSMREIVIEALEAYDVCPYDHKPNTTTLQSIKNIEQKKNLIEAESIDDLLKKIGL